MGDWEVYPVENRLCREGQVEHLEPRAMQVLSCLAEHPGRVRTRAELLAAGWNGAPVGDLALTQAVSLLRKTLGDTPHDSHYVETIPKRGYRLVAPVAPLPVAPLPVAPLPVAPLPAHPTPAPPASPAPRRPQALLRSGMLGGLLGGMLFAVGFTLLVASDGPAPVPPALPRPVRLTSYPGLELDPALSPDGARLAFAWRQPGRPDFDLYIQPVEGATTPHRLTTDPADEVRPVWSPDGQALVYARLYQGGCTLMWMRLPAGPARRLRGCGAERQPTFAWSPDGTSLVLSDGAGRGAPYRLLLVSLETRAARPLTTPPAASNGDRFPAFSPDGRTVAFARTHGDGTTHLLAVDVRSLRTRLLAALEAPASGLTWSPDGRTLYFSGTRLGTGGLWAVDAGGGKPWWLGPEHALLPSAARHKGRLAFVQASGDADLWRLGLGADTLAAPFARSTQWEYAPAIAPGGRRVAFVSHRSGSAEVWTETPGGADPIPLTRLGGPAPRDPRWSPDGAALAYSVDERELYVVPAAGGTPRRLAGGTAAHTAPAWSRDGRWVYAGSTRSGDWQVWRFPTGAGRPEQLTRGGGVVSREAPGGEALFFTRPDTCGLWRLDLATGATRLFLDALAREDARNWDVLPDGIAFVRRGGQPALAFYAFATGAVTTLRALPPGLLAGAAVAVAPDRSWALAARPAAWETDVVMATLPE